MVKKVCIIGAGVSGITSTKHCIEAGLEPTCYEASDHVTGLWNRNNVSAVPNCTVTNTSKEMSCFSDFPMPEDFPNFMHAEKFFEYFKSYIENYNLSKYFKTGCEVLSVECCDTVHGNCLCETCVKENGKYWKVAVNNKGNKIEEFFDFIIVANGFNNVPFIPEDIREVTKGFAGELIHSSQYRSWETFENQKIVISGLGNSAGDIGCELSRHASQVYLATKHGNLILSRLNFSGYPLDAKILRRSSNLVPSCLRNKFIPVICNNTFNHANFGLERDALDPSPHSVPLINDEIATRISTGSLLIKPGVMKTKDRKVYFNDGSFVDDVDTFILCTGYKREFKFLKKTDLVDMGMGEKYLGLYKYIFPTKHIGKIAFIGMTGVSGSVCPVFEMQARYAVEVFKGTVKLPSDTEMKKNVSKSMEHWKQIRNKASEMMRVNFISYQDELASEIGVKPRLWSLLLKDPVLAWCLFFGPACPYQYRLSGPGAWDGARDAILTVDKRIWYPLSKEFAVKQSTFSYFAVLVILCFIFAVISILSSS